MAGKKKKEEKESSNYDVLIGYVHNWEYLHPNGDDQMNGHPMLGRCYRLIKDLHGYRLHIGRENNDAGLDGLFLGPDLKAERKDFLFDIELVTPKNYLSLPINSEDGDKISEWVQTESQDLWDKIKLEESGTIPVVKTLSDLFALIKKAKEEADEIKELPESTSIPQIIHPEFDIIEISDQSDRTAEILSNALNKINENDEAIMPSIAVALDYVASRYDKDPRPLTHHLSTASAEAGRGANIWYTIKQLENYISGAESSSTVGDLYIAIHHLLLEIQRRQTINKR